MIDDVVFSFSHKRLGVGSEVKGGDVEEERVKEEEEEDDDDAEFSFSPRK